MKRSINPFHEVRTYFAKGAFVDTRSLYVFLQEEKNVLHSIKQIATEKRVASQGLIAFGRPQGDDLTDVTDKVGELMLDWSDTLADFANSYEQYQTTLRTIRDKENTLASYRDKRRKLQDLIQTTQKNQPNTSKLPELQQQLEKLELEALPAETDLANFKRIALKEAFYTLFNALTEFSGKTGLVASFGKYIIDELDVTPIAPGDQRKPYKSSEQTTRVLNDARQALQVWQPNVSDLRRTLTLDRGNNPLTRHNRAEVSDEDSDDPLPAPSQSVPEAQRQNRKARRPAQTRLAEQRRASWDAADSTAEPEHQIIKDRMPQKPHQHSQSSIPPLAPKPTAYQSPVPSFSTPSSIPTPPAQQQQQQYSPYPLQQPQQQPQQQNYFPPTLASYPPQGINPEYQQYNQFYQQAVPARRPYEEVSKYYLQPQQQQSYYPRRDPGGFIVPGLMAQQSQQQQQQQQQHRQASIPVPTPVQHTLPEATVPTHVNAIPGAFPEPVKPKKEITERGDKTEVPKGEKDKPKGEKDKEKEGVGKSKKLQGLLAKFERG